MSQALEQRVEELERKVADLSAQILALLSREAERLGRKYRQQQRRK